MVRPIMKDPIFLSRKSVEASPADVQIGKDLLETLIFHKEGCVGMAANMIGETKRIIAFDCGGDYMVMYNPEIVKSSEPYETEEGCLSLPGVRSTKRFRKIKVRYQNEAMQVRMKSFEGWTAQIIQHEIDHCNGILI